MKGLWLALVVVTAGFGNASADAGAVLESAQRTLREQAAKAKERRKENIPVESLPGYHCELLDGLKILDVGRQPGMKRYDYSAHTMLVLTGDGVVFQEYAVALVADATMNYQNGRLTAEHVPTLRFAFIKNPGNEEGPRQVLIPPTAIRFDDLRSPDQKTVTLLGDGAIGKDSPALEMTCRIER